MALAYIAISKLQQYIELRGSPVFCLSILFSCLSELLVNLPICPILLCFFVFTRYLSEQLFVPVPVCLSICLPVLEPVSFLCLYLLSLSVSLRCLEVQLPSLTVKCSAYWKGHFSNGATLPLIFCLPLGARLIYHASSPADIQIHFDWRLDGMTPTIYNTASTTAALTRMHKHTQSNVTLCTLSQVCSGYEYAYYANTYPLTFWHEDTCIQLLTDKLPQSHTD